VEGQVVAMTFDDGPHAQNTPRLLDILKQRGIKATFFVVGQNAVEYPDILKRIVADGHELANHSYSHPILASLSEAALRDQLEKTHQAVLNATGVNMKVMRPPYGALSEPQRRWTNATFGYRTILWDVDPLDWKFRDAARVESEILGHAKAGSIILSHDIHKSTVDAMPSTLDTLTAKGFKFVTVSELIALDRPSAPKAPAAQKPTAKAAASKPAPSTGPKPVSKPAKEEPSTRKVAAAQDVKTSTAASKNSGSTASSSDSPKNNSAPKTAPLSQEELRKKWLQSMTQR
jgi:peptidoglycan/xylan/chitin deacetylase (PgdA/CDA1 family)